MASPASSGQGGTPKPAQGSRVRLAGLGLLGFVAGSSLGWLWGLLQRPAQPLNGVSDPPGGPAVHAPVPVYRADTVSTDNVATVAETVAETDAAQGVRQAAALAKAKLAASLSRLPTSTPGPDDDAQGA